MSNKLNQLLENAKHESPLLTENDVISVINNRNLLGKKQTFFTLKNILIMSVLSSIIVGLWMVFYQTANTNLAEQTQPNSPKNKEQLTEKSAANNLLANADNNKKFTTIKETGKSEQVVDSPKNFPAINNKPAAKLFEPIPFTPLFNENPIDDNRNYFDKDGYLILTNKELAKLGIITDGNVLKYENVTDTVRATYIGKMIIYAYTKSIIKIENGKYFLSHTNFKSQDYLDSNDKKFWPSALTILNKNDSDVYVLENIWSKGYETDFFNEAKPFLIPIVVNTNNKKSVFWFKAEPLFYKALEPDVKIVVEKRYSFINHNNYINTMIKYREIGRDKAYNKGFNGLVINKLRDRFSLLNDGELKKIDIIKNIKNFEFKFTDQENGNFKVVTFKNKKKIKITKFRNLYFWENRKKSDFLIVASSDLKMTFINYFKVFNDSISYIKQNQYAEEYLLKNIDKLIPIYSGQSVIWFEPTPKLLEIIRKHKIKVVQKDIKKKRSPFLLNLNEFEYQKLGISFEKKAIKMPIISFKNSSAFISLRKRNSSTLFHFDTLNTQNKPLYPIPLLVTDQSGLYWRYYNLDTTYEVGKFNEYASRMTQQLNNCIPLKIVQNNVSIIAWYEPDSLFLSLLPNKESTEIKTEYHAISNNLPAPSCKYFEVCQNVTGKINSYLAYPNPAEQTLNIEIDLAEERQLEFIVTDITGKIIKTLNQNLNQAKGIQTYTYQIGELTEGMYLLIITTDKGEKVSTRIVKK
jgi:hypothetical protein